MITLIKETALKITGIRPSSSDAEQTVLSFEDGRETTFLKWFVDLKKPKVGAFLVKDTEGFSRIVDSL